MVIDHQKAFMLFERVNFDAIIERPVRVCKDSARWHFYAECAVGTYGPGGSVYHIVD